MTSKVRHEGCEICHEPFIAPRRQRFCSIRCMVRGRSPLGPRRLKKWTEDELSLAYERVRAGTTIKQIAVEANVNQTSIGRLLQRRFGYVPTPYRRPTLTIPDDPAIRGYIAGLIDGEGSIMFQNKHWMMRIAMTDEPVIRWLAAFGALFYPRKVLPNRKPAFAWEVHRRHDLIHLLTAVGPYLRVKRELGDRALSEISLGTNDAIVRGPP